MIIKHRTPGRALRRLGTLKCIGNRPRRPRLFFLAVWLVRQLSVGLIKATQVLRTEQRQQTKTAMSDCGAGRAFPLHADAEGEAAWSPVALSSPPLLCGAPMWASSCRVEGTA